MRPQLPIKIRVECIDNKGMEGRFDKGVEYAWLGFTKFDPVDENNKDKEGKYWQVEDVCLHDSP